MIIFTLALLLFTLPQGFSHTFVPGVGVTYGSNIKSAGLNLRGYDFIDEHICFGPEFSYFSADGVRNEEFSLMELNFIGHYVFKIAEHLGAYPLSGLNYSIEKRREPDSENEKAWGLNVGGGIHYELAGFFPFLEYKFITGPIGQQSISIGVLLMSL